MHTNGLLYIPLLISHLWNVCGCLPRPLMEIICQLLLLLLLLIITKIYIYINDFYVEIIQFFSVYVCELLVLIIIAYFIIFEWLWDFFMKRKQVSVFVHVQRNSVWLLTHLQKKKIMTGLILVFTFFLEFFVWLFKLYAFKYLIVLAPSQLCLFHS